MPIVSRRTALRIVLASLAVPVVAVSAAVADQSTLKFVIYKSKGQFRWRLKAGNGQVIATGGEAYTTKASCKNAIESIKRGAATATIEEPA